MISLTVILTIMGMGAVTYIPRMLPFFIMEDKELPAFVQGVLKNVPYAVLGALIFPAIFLIQEGNILFGIIGGSIAFLIAFLGADVMVVVIGSIFILSLYAFFF